MPPPRRDLTFPIGLTVITVLAAFTRLETIGQRPLWFDERYTFNFCARAGSLGGAWAAALADGWEHPPLHYALTWLVMQASKAAAVIRLPSALCGIATVVMVAVLGRRLLGATAGLLAGLLLALSTYHINYSMDARPYAMLAMLITLEMLLLYRYLETGRPGLLAPLALAATAAVYTHHLAVTAQGVVAAIALLHLTVPGLSLSGAGRDTSDRAAPVRPRPRPARLLAGLALAGLASAVLYLPQGRNLAHYLSTEKLERDHTLRISLEMIRQVSARWGPGPGWPDALVLALLLLGVAGIVLRWRRALGLLIWLVVPFLPFVILPFGKFWDIRFVMPALPAFVLVLSAGLVQAGRMLARAGAAVVPSLGRFPRAATAVTILLALLLAAESALVYRQFRWTRYRCSEFYVEPDILDRNGGFCREHLILNTLVPGTEYLLRPLHDRSSP